MNILNMYMDLFSLVLVLMLLFNTLLRKVEINTRKKCFRVMLVLMAFVLTDHALIQYVKYGEMDMGRRVLDTLVLAGFFILMGVFFHFCIAVIRKNGEEERIYLSIGYTLAVGSSVIWAVCCLSGNAFHKVNGIMRYTQAGTWVVYMSFFLILVYLVFLIVYNHARLGFGNALFLSLLPCAPLLAGLVFCSAPGLALRLPITALSLLVIYIRFYIDDGIRLSVQDRKLRRSQEAAMIGSVSPELVHGVMERTEDLCLHDPEKAKHYLEIFSFYLREKIDSYDRGDVNPFGQELCFATSYIELLDLCFPGRVRVRYEILEEDFLVPRMTLQLLLQNYLEKTLRMEETSASVLVGSRLDKKKMEAELILLMELHGKAPHLTFAERDSTTESRLEERLAACVDGRLCFEEKRDTLLEIRIWVPAENRRAA